VVDCAHGATYHVAPSVFEELGAEVIPIGVEPDGFNINENCGALHPIDVQKAVRRYRADIGFALDGDADRLVVVDEKGELVDGDQLLGALGLFMHKHGFLKGDGIVATVMSNQALEDALQAAGMKLHRCGVGDKYVLETMREHGINFGGEQSGHVIMHDFAKTGDGLVTALQVLAMVLTEGRKASGALRPFELYPQQLVNLSVKSKKPLEAIDGLANELSGVEADGIRHLIRYSGTENKLRILLEGRDREAMQVRMDRLRDFFRHALND